MNAPGIRVVELSKKSFVKKIIVPEANPVSVYCSRSNFYTVFINELRYSE